MARPGETEEDPLPGDEEDEAPPYRRYYDPLFTAWDDEPEVASAAGTAWDDDFRSLYPAGETREADDYPAWQMPPGSARAGEAGHYERFAPGYTEGMTDLQRRLHAETITLPRPRRRWVVTVRELAETLLLAVLIFLAVRASFQNFRVEGDSMQPSLENGEYLIVNKLAYSQIDFGLFDWLPFVDSGDNAKHHLFSSPSRGDVVVFLSPTSPNRDFIKRVIGVPGDTIEMDDLTGEVKVNGQSLSEPYIVGTTHCNSSCQRTVPQRNTPESVTECGSNACYFVMGDNRQNSSDSRQGWLVPEENIIGKALLTYWHHGEPELDWAPNHSVGLADEAAAKD